MSEQVFPAELNQPLPRAVMYNKKMPIAFSIVYLVIILLMIGIYYGLVDLTKADAGMRAFHFHLCMINFIFISICVFINFMWGYYTEKNLIQNGTVTRARVSVQREYDFKNHCVVDVVYEFNDLEGNTIRGKRNGLLVKFENNEDKLAAFVRSLSSVIVLYSPENSKRNMLYPGLNASCYLPQVKEK